MALARLISPLHLDIAESRISNIAFKHATRRSGDEVDTPDGRGGIWIVEIVPTASDRGDPCHRDVHGFSDKRASKIRKKHLVVADLMICTDGSHEPFSWKRIRELMAA